MMIEKVDTSFLGGVKVAQTSDFAAILRFKPFTVSASRYAPIPPNLRKWGISVFYNFPPNFKPKFWQ